MLYINKHINYTTVWTGWIVTKIKITRLISQRIRNFAYGWRLAPQKDHLVTQGKATVYSTIFVIIVCSVLFSIFLMFTPNYTSLPLFLFFLPSPMWHQLKLVFHIFPPSSSKDNIYDSFHFIGLMQYWTYMDFWMNFFLTHTCICVSWNKC